MFHIWKKPLFYLKYNSPELIPIFGISLILKTYLTKIRIKWWLTVKWRIFWNVMLMSFGNIFYKSFSLKYHIVKILWSVRKTLHKFRNTQHWLMLSGWYAVTLNTYTHTHTTYTQPQQTSRGEARVLLVSEGERVWCVLACVIQ